MVYITFVCLCVNSEIKINIHFRFKSTSINKYYIYLRVLIHCLPWVDMLLDIRHFLIVQGFVFKIRLSQNK